MAAAASPNITLYTNRICPWAQRAHIALAELNLPFTEETVDLAAPRTEAYLKINPRGLVPSLAYNGQILTESAIVATFLADAHPSHLVPNTGSPEGALRRARIAFFVDTYVSKVNTVGYKIFSTKSDDEVAEIAKAQVEAIVREVEPLLSDASPFFGGSEKLTLAEVLTGSFILRLYSSAKHGVIPSSTLTDLETHAPNFTRWAEAVRAHRSVNGIYNEETYVAKQKERIAKNRAA